MTGAWNGIGLKHGPADAPVTVFLAHCWTLNQHDWHYQVRDLQREIVRRAQTAGASLADAVGKLGERRIGALPVVEAGEIVGIISERDVIYCLRDHGADVLNWPVMRVMSSPAI